MQKNITIKGARTHNLKDIDLEIPRDQLVVITGLSGSGKSSLAFNTLYAEGQRRYVESLSSYARQFLSVMEKPDVDHIAGLSPAISIEQKSVSHNPRSTVGTITEIYDYLRLLFARVGQPRCPEHNTILEAQTVTQMVDAVMALQSETKMMLVAPIVQNRKGEYVQLFDDLQRQGFIRARVDGNLIDLDHAPPLDLQKKHNIEVVIDRLKIRDGIQLRLAESFETALRLADGLAKVVVLEEKNKTDDLLFSAKYACPTCGYSLPELEPRLFSFNNPVGACPDCDGLGMQELFDEAHVVSDPSLSLSGGAVRGWDRHNIYYYHMLLALSKHYDFDIDQPFEKLPKKIQKIILYGSGKERIQFRYVNDHGTVFERTSRFEGVLPNMERRYRETDSEAVREMLSRYLTIKPCETCQGARLREEARYVFIQDVNLPTLTSLSIEQVLLFLQQAKFSGHKQEIAARILKEVINRLQFLVNVGLDYLTLDRRSQTLSGGESQRIHLASQIGAGLMGVMYVLDEPTIGLHQRDNERLLKTLMHLRDLGNTVIVIEHDEQAIRDADYIVDMGPGAGVHGGRVVAQGTALTIQQCKESLTGQYLSGKQQIAIPKKRMAVDKQRVLRLCGATCNNLKNVNVDIPIGLMTCVTGVSGSGKSSLINDTLYPIAATKLNKATHLTPGAYTEIIGLDYFDKVVDIDQSPIGRTPRSNPATYTGIFTPVRELFSSVPEARSRGYSPGRFSFNVKGGRCEACQGDGLIKVEMHFLSDIYVTCDICKGKRYNRETLSIKYKGKNIHEVLNMTVEEAHAFFEAIPVLSKKTQTLMEVGLSYIRLGQSAITLSGGEAQRVKLSRELSKRDTGNTLYILDEPTTGLHFHDIKQLLDVLHHLRERGNTIVIIEHNLDVIKTADWIIDLGPEGGDKGGTLVAQGTPEQVAQCKKSFTGIFLKKILTRVQHDKL